MKIEIDTSEPVLASVEALRRFFLRQLNTQLHPVWVGSPTDDSIDFIEFNGPLARIGLTGLRANRTLSKDEREQISDTFQTILGGILQMRERLDLLRRVEAHQAQHLDEQISNVVPLQRPQNHRDNSGHVFFPKDNRWILKLDCLIESPHVSEITKMARELHEHSQRVAFVEFKDLQESERHYPEDFTKLGTITVFIPDIFLLSRKEQFCLTQAIRHDATHRPLIMVGTHMPFALLRTEEHIYQDFLQLISRAYLKLTKPVAHYKSEGLFHYFLDSLT